MIPNAFIETGWVIVADADEYLILSGDFANIFELVRFMEAQESICAAGQPG